MKSLPTSKLGEVIFFLNSYIKANECERVKIKKKIEKIGINKEDFEVLGPFFILDACKKAINKNNNLEIEEILSRKKDIHKLTDNNQNITYSNDDIEVSSTIKDDIST